MSDNSASHGEDVDEFQRLDAIEHTDGEWTHVNQSHYDPEDERELVTELASAIADAKRTDPLDYADMPPLNDAVDVQALEEAFFGIQETESRGEEAGAVTFRYTGYKVALRADGWILVYEPA